MSLRISRMCSSICAYVKGCIRMYVHAFCSDVMYICFPCSKNIFKKIYGPMQSYFSTTKA